MLDSVKKAVIEPINALGYDLVNVTFEQNELTLYIKGAKPITHKDCERVSKAVDDIIEELDPTKGQSYSLSVSSVGIK